MNKYVYSNNFLFSIRSEIVDTFPVELINNETVSIFQIKIPINKQTIPLDEIKSISLSDSPIGSYLDNPINT
ncbi:hypothetical protein QTN25_000029 [Entamoeba marina]